MIGNVRREIIRWNANRELIRGYVIEGGNDLEEM